jgi:hypothetical protein
MHYSTNTPYMGVGVTTRTVLRWDSCLSKIWLYAGIPVNAAVLALQEKLQGSDNLSDADNQQERLIKIGWLACRLRRLLFNQFIRRLADN